MGMMLHASYRDCILALAGLAVTAAPARGGGGGGGRGGGGGGGGGGGVLRRDANSIAMCAYHSNGQT
jgi:hypothetical protein